MEFQKSIRRRENGKNQTIWGSEIRAPINNWVASGMALMIWGVEDGRVETKEEIAPVDSFTVGPRAFWEVQREWGGNGR